MAKNILLGAHMSIAKGFYLSIERGEAVGCTAIQIFTKSNRSWYAKKLTTKEIDLFKKAFKKSKKIKEVIVHACYLINIGSPNTSLEKKSIAALSVELDRCKQLEIPYLILHPGAHLKSDEDKCLKRISKNLDIVLKNSKGKTKILLETMAGQGSTVGYTFEQLKEIRKACKEKRKIGICIDTCHIFTAGYNISTPSGYESVIKQFDNILGLNLLKAIHLNDSKAAFNSKVDRHADIGQGKIPLKIFSLIMNDKRLKNIPKILETPNKEGRHGYKEEIKLLRKMVK